MATAADSAMLRKISLIEDLVPFNISQWSHSPFQVTPFLPAAVFGRPVLCDHVIDSTESQFCCFQGF